MDSCQKRKGLLKFKKDALSKEFVMFQDAQTFPGMRTHIEGRGEEDQVSACRRADSQGAASSSGAPGHKQQMDGEVAAQGQQHEKEVAILLFRLDMEGCGHCLFLFLEEGEGGGHSPFVLSWPLFLPL